MQLLLLHIGTQRRKSRRMKEKDNSLSVNNPLTSQADQMAPNTHDWSSSFAPRHCRRWRISSSFSSSLSLLIPSVGQQWARTFCFLINLKSAWLGTHTSLLLSVRVLLGGAMNDDDCYEFNCCCCCCWRMESILCTEQKSASKKGTCFVLGGNTLCVDAKQKREEFPVRWKLNDFTRNECSLLLCAEIEIISFAP